ncbi:MAG: class I SAM-dependent methyltransferase [Nanoarchaeota archaeon]
MNFTKNTINFYEKIANDYSKSWDDIEIIKRELNFFLEFIKGKKILDIGCGHGRDCKYFSEKGFETIGIDLSENFLKIAKKKSPLSKFAKMDMRKLNFPKESFDGLWVCSSFLHIPQKNNKETMKEFYRVLKKEGIMFIAVKLGKGEKIKNGKYDKLYSKKEFEKLIKNTGFHIQKSYINRHKKDWIIIFATK